MCSIIHTKRYLCGSGRAWAVHQRAVRLVTGHPNSAGGTVIPPGTNVAAVSFPIVHVSVPAPVGAAAIHDPKMVPAKQSEFRHNAAS